MATKNQAPEAAPELLEISELRTRQKISRAIFAGVCSANGWKPGKRVSEEEFQTAVKQFTEAPMDGKPRKKKEAD
jgi:hypothetical protein